MKYAVMASAVVALGALGACAMSEQSPASNLRSDEGRMAPANGNPLPGVPQRDGVPDTDGVDGPGATGVDDTTPTPNDIQPG
jgi:hypothetical protein